MPLRCSLDTVEMFMLMTLSINEAVARIVGVGHELLHTSAIGFEAD